MHAYISFDFRLTGSFYIPNVNVEHLKSVNTTLNKSLKACSFDGLMHPQQMENKCWSGQWQRRVDSDVECSWRVLRGVGVQVGWLAVQIEINISIHPP